MNIILTTAVFGNWLDDYSDVREHSGLDIVDTESDTDEDIHDEEEQLTIVESNVPELPTPVDDVDDVDDDVPELPVSTDVPELPTSVDDDVPELLNISDIKPIPGYEDYTITRDGRIYSKYTRKYRKFFLNNGRYAIHLTNKQKVKKVFHLNKLICDIFYENKPQNYRDMYIIHKNGNKRDCRIDNLAYVSKSDLRIKTNSKTARRAVKLLDPKGEIIKTFDSISSAARYLNCSVSNVHYACTGQIRKCCGHTVSF